MIIESDRDRSLDLMSELSHLSIENSALEWSLYRHHSAADVDTDRRRNDRVLCRDNRSDHGTFSEVRVGHQRNVFIKARQTRDVSQHVFLFQRQSVTNPREDVRLCAANV